MQKSKLKMTMQNEKLVNIQTLYTELRKKEKIKYAK
jgi:hypothetical protein